MERKCNQRVAFGTQRESLDLCFVSRGPDYRDREDRKRETVFYSTLFYYLTKYLCGGQHCVFIQAEDSVGHYGLVGQEATAHHLQTQSTMG